jgi:hypothetical protein
LQSQSQQILGARFSDDSLALLLLPLPPFAYTHYHIHSSTSVITLIDTGLRDYCLCQGRILPKLLKQSSTSSERSCSLRVRELATLQDEDSGSETTIQIHHSRAGTLSQIRARIHDTCCRHPTSVVAATHPFPPFRVNWIIMHAYADSSQTSS